MDIPEPLLRLVARASDNAMFYHGLGLPPEWPMDEYDLQLARLLLEALDAEGLEVRPKVLSQDINDSESGA